MANVWDKLNNSIFFNLSAIAYIKKLIKYPWMAFGLGLNVDVSVAVDSDHAHIHSHQSFSLYLSLSLSTHN